MSDRRQAADLKPVLVVVYCLPSIKHIAMSWPGQVRSGNQLLFYGVTTAWRDQFESFNPSTRPLSWTSWGRIYLTQHSFANNDMCLYTFLVYTGPNHIDIKLNGHVVNGYMQGVFLPAPLVSTEIKKVSEQPEDLFKELKISMEQQLYLAPWPFLSDPGPIIVYPCHSLTNSLTDDLVEDLMNWPLLMESNI